MHKSVNTCILVFAGAALTFAAPTASAESHAKHTYKVCRHSSGTTGLIAGGAGGAMVGHALIGGPIGIAAGAVGGALGGRAVDRSMTAKKRCHYETR